MATFSPKGLKSCLTALQKPGGSTLTPADIAELDYLYGAIREIRKLRRPQGKKSCRNPSNVCVFNAETRRCRSYPRVDGGKYRKTVDRRCRACTKTTETVHSIPVTPQCECNPDTGSCRKVGASSRVPAFGTAQMKMGASLVTTNEAWKQWVQSLPPGP